MNRWYQIRRLRGAAWLILIGVLALLNQWHILSWDKSWPLFLIVPGVLILAERAAWSADVREQQTAQTMGQTAQPLPPNPSGPWAAPPSTPGQPPFIQTHPPDEPGREDR